ncbi:MAG: hypothetical protein FWH26_09920 [Oscillospiraceae bacterium]|nr:hypothetical protein [Oscillospiraceae bacterium]
MNRIFLILRNPRARRDAVIAAVAMAVSLALVFLPADTLAWMASSDSKTNELSVMQYVFSQQLTEIFEQPGALVGGDAVTKINWVKNDGDIPFFVRVKVFPVLLAPDGATHLEARFGKQLHYVNLNTANWKDGGDGCFYYTGKLAPGASTQPLFEKIRLDQEIVTDSDAVLTVTLIAETVETRQWHYRQAWWGSGDEVNGGPLGEVDQALRVLAQ